MERPLDNTSEHNRRLISLTTDFGNQDYYVASLKANLYQSPHEMTLVDVSHEIATHDIVKAAFFIKNCYGDFPPSTIHLVLVNNSYDYDTEFICFQYQGQFFIGPNNGLFSLAFNDIDETNIRLIPSFSKEKSSFNTTIANAVHHILEHHHINNLGTVLGQFDQKLGIQAVYSNDEIRVSVIHVDHYQNVIVNLTKDAFEEYRKGRDYKVFIKPTDPIEFISESYAEVPVGEALCIFNEIGYLTIAINMGQASSMYSLNLNDTIQIIFE